MTFTEAWLVAFGFGIVLFVAYLMTVPHRHVEEGEEGSLPLVSFVGGLRWSGQLGLPLYASAPLVRVEGHAWGIRVGPSVSLMRFVIPLFEATFDEIDTVRKRGRNAVELCLTTGEPGFVCLVLRRADLLDFLGSHGAVVEE